MKEEIIELANELMFKLMCYTQTYEDGEELTNKVIEALENFQEIEEE